MAGYIGTRCMVCNEKFTSEDDVVICPECGTPYHRACYEKNGSCINDVLHRNGGAWKPSYDGDSSAESHGTVCAFCGYTNPPLTLFCRRCGMPSQSMSSNADRMEQRYGGININDDPNAYNRNANSGTILDPFLINYSDPLCGFSPDEDFDGVKLAELGDFVGTNTHYYLPLFKQFKEYGRKFSLNFCAMLFPEMYFSYRKMPLVALGAFILRLISRIPQFIYAFAGTSEYGLLSSLASGFDIRGSAFRGLMLLSMLMYYALMFVFGFFGNKLYYENSIRRIKKIKSSSDGANIRYEIMKKGGTSALLLTLFICLAALPYLAIYFMQFFSVISI